MKIDFDLYMKYVSDGFFTVEKHEEADLYIFGYSTGAYRVLKNVDPPVWDENNVLMRGLIVNSEGEILARSFTKFFKFESYLSPNSILLNDHSIFRLDQKKFRVFEKMDGSLSVLYWIGETPYLSTQRSFSSLKAKKATKILQNKYADSFKKLRKDRTYIFEAIYPESKVLVDYGNQEKLVLIGVIDNETGQSLTLEDIGFPIVKEWTNDLSSVKNLKQLESLNFQNMEGFVLLFEDDTRIKIVFPWYEKIHKLLNSLIGLEAQKDILEKKLKKALKLPKRTFNKKDLWCRFEKGDKPNDILEDFPLTYSYMAIKEFLNQEYSSFISNERSSDALLLNLTLDLTRNPKNENVMWNRINKLEKKYDL